MLYSNDPEMRLVLSYLIPQRGPYFVWLAFLQEELTRDYERHLRSIDILLIIPESPLEVKKTR